MLKLSQNEWFYSIYLAAAFGRLCVETFTHDDSVSDEQPAAFGRLCVETLVMVFHLKYWVQPPSGGCVLKLRKVRMVLTCTTSRLRAAVC